MSDHQPFLLTIADVRAKGLAALRAGKLTAQAERYQDRRCAYVVDAAGCRCIIGAALPPEALQRVMDTQMNHASFFQLLDAKIISASPSEQDELMKAQVLHDNWARASLSVGRLLDSFRSASEISSTQKNRDDHKAKLVAWLETSEVVS